MRRTRSGRADRRSNWRRVAPRSSAAGSVAPSRGEREPSRRRSPQPPAASRQPYSRTAVSRQLAVAVAAAAAAAVSELLRRVADAVWTRAAQRRASVLGVGSARARADGACKQTACTAHSFKRTVPSVVRGSFVPSVVRGSFVVKFFWFAARPRAARPRARVPFRCATLSFSQALAPSLSPSIYPGHPSRPCLGRWP